MAKVTFEADSLEDLVLQMKKWISAYDSPNKSSDIVNLIGTATGATSDLAKAAIAMVANSAPEPISSNEIFKKLTQLGYEVTESAQKTVTSTLDTLATDDGIGIVEKVDKARDAALYEMSQAVARRVLKIIGL